MSEHQQKKHFRNAIDHRLSGIEENPWLAQRIINIERGENKVKKRLPRTYIVAIIVIVCLMVSGTVVAAAGAGIISLFSNGKETNENITDGIQSVDARYDGKAVNFIVNEAIYDDIGGTFALDWSIENINDRDDLYIICSGVYLGEERAHQRTTVNFSDFILETGTTECMMLGELPENSVSECRMEFVVLRGLAPFAVVADESSVESVQAESERLRSEGYIPVNSMDIVCGVPYSDMSEAERLVAMGEFEVVENVSLNLTLEQDMLDSTARVYNGPTEFVFDGYEIKIRKAVCTATSVRVDVEYITSEAPRDGGKGFGPMWGLEFDIPGVESWTGNSGGSIHDPVQLEDGRYLNLYEFEATTLYVQPEVLRMTLVTYGDSFAPTYYTDDSIELVFE